MGQFRSAKMTKGTTSRGTRNDKTHILCRVTGRRTYHIQKKRSSVRGRFNWSAKAKRRSAELLVEELIIFKRNDPPSEDDSTGPPRPRDELGTGRCRHLKNVNQRFHNGFREGQVAQKKK